MGKVFAWLATIVGGVIVVVIGALIVRAIVGNGGGSDSTTTAPPTTEALTVTTLPRLVAFFPDVWNMTPDEAQTVLERAQLTPFIDFTSSCDPEDPQPSDGNVLGVWLYRNGGSAQNLDQPIRVVDSHGSMAAAADIREGATVVILADEPTTLCFSGNIFELPDLELLKNARVDP
jgi:hypothetical protein